MATAEAALSSFLADFDRIENPLFCDRLIALTYEAGYGSGGEAWGRIVEP